MSDISDCIIKILVDNGVSAEQKEIWGFAGKLENVIQLDFSEHDKVFEDKIAKLENQIARLNEEKSFLRTRCMPYVEKDFDNRLYGKLAIVSCNEEFVDIGKYADGDDLYSREVRNLISEGGIKRLIGQYRNLSSRLDKMSDENKELKQRIAELESKETEKPTKINLNDQIKVKLTPLGAEIYYHQYDELNKWIKERGGKQLEPRMPEIDKDGYTKFTLWNFMELYGEHIGMCKPSVISPLYIELCQDEWKMRYNEEPIEKGKE